MERQLDIFKSKRQKGALPPSPTEFEIHCAVADYLRHGLAAGWIWHHPPNGEYRMKATSGRLKRMGTKPGVSDICLHKAPHCQLHALELKRKGMKPNPEQRAWMESVRALGGQAEWADSVELALLILTQWGAISTRIHLQAG